MFGLEMGRTKGCGEEMPKGILESHLQTFVNDNSFLLDSPKKLTDPGSLSKISNDSDSESK